MNEIPPAPLSPAAEALFAQILTGGGVLPRTMEGGVQPACDAVAELLRFGLLGRARQPTVHGLSLSAVDPHQAAARWRSVLVEQALREIAAAERYSRPMDELAGAFDAAATHTRAEKAVYRTLSGHDEINQLIGQLMAGCTFEFLTLHPNTRSAAQLRRGMDIDTDVAQRQGMVYRSLYPVTERDRPEIVEFVTALTAAGAQYRTVQPMPDRLFLFDAHTAVIAVRPPDAEQQWVACCVTDPPVVAYLRNLFGRLWERAQPLGDTHAPAAPPDLDDTQHEVLTLLHEGLTHIQIARRLGLTQRTVATYVAQLKDACKVNSLYQLGAAAARLGLLDHQAPSA